MPNIKRKKKKINIWSQMKISKNLNIVKVRKVTVCNKSTKQEIEFPRKYKNY